MDQDPNAPARAWQPTAPQSERRTGSWSRNGGGSEHLTEVSAVSDALGIEMHPSASYASLDPATSSPYASPTQAPRPDRPLLSSPRSATSARFHRHASSTQYAAVPGDMGAIDEQRPSPAASQVRFVSEKPEVEQQQQQQQHHHASENKNNPFAFEQVDLGTGQYDGARDGQRGNPVEGMYATGGYAPAAPPGPYNYPNSGFSQSTDFADAHFMDTYHDRVTRNCLSTAEVERRPSDGWPITVLLLSLYSTCASVAWLVIACLKPTWKFVGSGPGAFEPANATMVSALIAKTIEISFITVFVTFLGQVISRRALSGRNQGVTLAELTLRNMVIQPGTLLTRNDSVRYTARTILGLIAMLATLGATFYTTASDAMVSPKLAFGSWGQRSLTGQIAASYANPNYMKQQCKTPVRSDDDKSGDSCLDVHFSGTSYHNLMEFMAAWEIISSNGSNLAQHLGSRPRGTANLFPNTTLVSAWIETDKGNISSEFEKHSLIINEVTLAMPHPGVYFAATDPLNGIPQPKDLGGVGEYSLRASVVSPAVNVKCVDMSKKDLAPLVYTEWPHADPVKTGVGNQTMGNITTWAKGVPSLSDDEYYNTTIVDDLFLWGKEHGRRPPIFRMFPADYNIVTNATPALWAQKAMYVLGKSPKTANYTLCQLESFLTPNCSTRFDVSGIKGGRMTAHCEDPDDEDAYHRKHAMNPDPQRRKEQWGPRGDWRNVADQMQLAVNLNGGEQNNNASNARLLTQLAVVPRDDGGPLGMPVLRPSMAEGLAVLFSSTLVMGAVDTPFGPDWQYDKPALGLPARQAFEASVRQQGYQSSHADRWQGVFYVVLAIVVVVNFVSLAFFVFSWRMRLTTDYSEPANLFAVALMSPPSHQFTGYCGSGVEGRALSVPWRVVGSPDHGGPGGADDDIDELCRPETDAEDSDATLGRGGNGNGNGGYAGASGFHPHQHQHQHPHMGMASGRDGPGGRPLHFYFRHAGNPVKGKWKGTEVGETPNLSAPQPTRTYQRLQNRKSWL
ncbi:hypothetical protein RB601_006522 [Gaeumannomyces tritici]